MKRRIKRETGRIAVNKEMEKEFDKKKAFKIYFDDENEAGRISFHVPGKIVKFRDGSIYKVQEDGSIRKVQLR
jgi:hypothetical protein